MIHDISATIQPGKHTVIHRNMRGELDLQTFDAYAYQRELEISRASDGAWHVIAYKNPFRPPTVAIVSRAVALRLSDRIWTLSQSATALLWNDTNERYAQHNGFVRFHDWLLHGALPSVKLLP
jgi:hypothetical protein